MENNQTTATNNSTANVPTYRSSSLATFLLVIGILVLVSGTAGAFMLGETVGRHFEFGMFLLIEIPSVTFGCLILGLSNVIQSINYGNFKLDYIHYHQTKLQNELKELKETYKKDNTVIQEETDDNNKND